MADDRSRAPKVDPRSNEEIVAQTEALLSSLTAGAWTPAAPSQRLDPLGALVRVFADMSGQLLDGINAVPDASFAAFLRLIGVEAQRPAPARAPLCFTLADGAPLDAVVPAGTKVGASAAEGDSDPTPIVFETEAELVVTRARLQASYAHAPLADRLDRLGPAPLTAFDPRTPAVHELLIACPELLARTGARSWTVTLELTAAAPDLELDWLGDTGAGWQPLIAATRREGTRLIVTLDRPPPLRAATIAGHEAVWLLARLVPRPGPPTPPPALRRVSLGASRAADDLAPNKLVRNATQLDAITDFDPFDLVPAPGTTLAIDGGDALAQPAGTSVVVTIKLPATLETDATRPRGSADLRIAWELLGPGGTWVELGRSSDKDPAILADATNPNGFVDDTYALSRSGRLRFRLPFTVGEQRSGGKAGRWLRARIAQGNYGAGATLRAPQVTTLRLGYSHTREQVPASRGVARDLGQARTLGAMDSDPPAPLFLTRPPGSPALGDQPALYLAFDRAFEARPVQLFVAVLAPDPAQTAPPDELPPVGDVPRIEWEYLGPGGWTRLGMRDETRGLRQRGIITFVGPTDSVRADLFDATGFWLRARKVSGSFRVAPQIAAITVNTTWARHAQARRNEVLGSGTGAPGQRFDLVAAPVLADERIEVREHDNHSERDLAALRAALGDDAVTVERNADGSPGALWVRWTGVTHFHGSGPADRHYVLDAERGRIDFGDGLAGRAPPEGRANIRAHYVTGGGPRGNRPIGAVAELKTAIAYIDGVRNIEPASGGTGREDEARVRARGPRRLRHRGRAVTASDLADLAFEAAPEVARAHVLTVPFNPIDVGLDLGAPAAIVRDDRGWVLGTTVPEDTARVSQRVAELRVVIVPHGDIDQPAPSIGLLERVETFLKDRAPPAMRAHVSGPRWIEVAVRAAIVADPSAPADRLVGELRAAITRFIHPLTGGELGQGWEFGRIPRRSHFYRLLARFPGVHHIQSLVVLTDPPLPAAGEALTIAQQRALAGALVHSGAHELTLVAAAEDL